MPVQAPAAGLIWLVGLSHATNHLVMLIFPSVLLLVQREFALSDVELGILANAGLLCYGLGALPAGMLADRIGGTRVLAIWLLGSGLACVGVGLSTGPWALRRGFGCSWLVRQPAPSGGIGGAGGAPPGFRYKCWARLWTPGDFGKRRVGRRADLRRGDRYALGMASGILGWRHSGVPFGHPMWQYSRLSRPPEVTRYEVPLAERRSIRSAFTLSLLLLFGLETLMGFVFQGFTTFLPTYLAGQAGIEGLSAAQARRGGSFASVALLFGGLGHLAAGRLMKSGSREVIFLASVVFNALCLFGMGVTQGFPLLLFSIALSFTHFALSTMSNTFIAFQTPPSLGGTAFGITFALSFGIGSLASSSMGVVAQRLGLPVVFLVLGGVAIGGATLVAWFGLATGVWSAGRTD